MRKPDDIRVTWFIERDDHRATIVQRDNGRRVAITPQQLVVNYWLSRQGLRWYVRIEGQVVKRDGWPGQHRRTVAFWPEHDDAGKRIENAPEWVQEVVAEAHGLVDTARLESGGSENAR